MSCNNPTGSEGAAALDLPAQHIPILRDVIASCLDGVQADLATPERMRDPGKAREEAATYERLLAGLAQGKVVVPDETARDVIRAIATASDEENNYAEVVAEHDALHKLLARLEGRRG